MIEFLAGLWAARWLIAFLVAAWICARIAERAYLRKHDVEVARLKRRLADANSEVERFEKLFYSLHQSLDAAGKAAMRRIR